MTIAVTPFDGLCGFRPLAEISHFLSTVPSLRKLVGEQAAKDFKSAIKGQDASSDSDSAQQGNKKALQAAFSALMKNDRSDVASAAKDLIASAEKEGEKFAGEGGPSNGGKELADLVVRLNGQFEGDIGLFVLFFLNYVKLEVGEAMFLKADDIHAYLSGGEAMILHPASSVWHADHITPTRHNRMHGLLRQRRPRRLHAQIPGHPHPHHNVDILLRAHILPENVPRRLPLRHLQQHGLLLLVLSHPLRPSNRRIQRR